MIKVTTTWGHLSPPSSTRKPTIYEVLKEKLEREPTNAELIAEVHRIGYENIARKTAKG